MKRISVLVLFALAVALGAAAQTKTKDPSILKPPAGAKVAIVVFEDLQCPDCRRAAPLVEQAARDYKIPLVRRDFPLPMHNWAKQAAVLARFFESKSKELGEQFREYIFEHQPELTPENIRGYAERFAKQKNVPLPFVVDPRGELEAQVMADVRLGESIGVSHTPTIYIVSAAKTGQPFVEVVDRRQLYALIDNMVRQAK